MVEANALAAAIGARVKQERKTRHWTLDQLAEVAGVSRRMIVNVENGAANPSVNTLLRISDALGIGLPALVEPPARSGVRVTRKDEGSTLWQGDHGGRGVLVAGTQKPDVLELWDWTLNVGDTHVSEEHMAGTKELLQVLSGTAEIVVGDEAFRLTAGDAITFSGDLPHSYTNVDQDTVRFVLAVFEPNVGSRENGAASARHS
ncbi:helix-turn-helix domain-containing protein [Luethyella okanaganae]|uniref:Helix-turn-helix domain-containing protein n=1 Tax=Luethyella okanaganae TaxID=69372 RepID=A0ABW1VCV5_9MICO